MINRYTGIHNAVVLVHQGEIDNPVRSQGMSDWDHVPTLEEYREGFLAVLVRDGVADDPSKIRVVELTFTIMDPETEEQPESDQESEAEGS